MIKSGIINKNNVIELDDDNLLFHLNKIIDDSEETKSFLEKYKQCQLFWTDTSIIDFFVKFLGYTIIHNNTLYFQNELQSKLIDKIEYVKNGFKLKKMEKTIFKNGRFIKYINPIDQEIELGGFQHSVSPENDLSFWYPKTSNIGFKTPKTIIINFTREEFDLIKSGKWDKLSKDSLIKRIVDSAKENNIRLDQEIFVRLGNSSNKFNFDSCHIRGIDELYQKLMIIFDDMYFKLEWQTNIELVLREFIKPSYQRNMIYNGMPLNTEFRVFYDFDENKFLGIFNYWDKDTMLDNLTNKDDLFTFANTTAEIENEFNKLYPLLKEEVEYKLPNANLNGKWSIDFLYDGKDFVLIDMAHAECSYYYSKVLSKQRILQ